MLPSKPFYLLRHAQSEANAKNIAAGSEFDSPLTEIGHQQAKALAPFMADLDPAPVRIYRSPMTRVRQTSQNVCAHLDLEVKEYKNLEEQAFGEWSGQPWADILPKMEQDNSPPGGESERDFTIRVHRVFHEILDDCTDGIPLIVAHGGVFHALGYIYGYSMSSIQNCHLHYFEPDDNHTHFPWISWQFDIEDGQALKKSTPFCPSLGANMIDRRASFASILDDCTSLEEGAE